MVDSDPRFLAVNKHVSNTFISSVIVKDLCEVLASELEQYIKSLNESEDLYGQTAGLIKATHLLRTGTEIDGSTFFN